MVGDRSVSGRNLLTVSLAVAALLVVGLLFAGVPAEQPATSPDQVATPTPTETAVRSVAGNTTVTVTYVDAGERRQFTVEGVDPALSSAEHGWTIVERSTLPPALARVDDIDGLGVVGFGTWALLGESTSATVEIDGTTLTVVVPAGRDVDPARKAGFVQQFAGPYALSPNETTPVVLVSVPDALPSYGLMYDDDRGYVTKTTFWDGDVHSVWIHEYVHARQDFRLTPEMTWFREASAEYLSYRFMATQYDAVTEHDIRERLDGLPAHEDVVLAEPSTWAKTNGDYVVGARLLAEIDAEIRAETDGDRTLVDVFRAMNRADGPITTARFVAQVEAVTGSEESWVAEAIAGERPIDGRPADRPTE